MRSRKQSSLRHRLSRLLRVDDAKLLHLAPLPFHLCLFSAIHLVVQSELTRGLVALANSRVGHPQAVMRLAQSRIRINRLLIKADRIFIFIARGAHVTELQVCVTAIGIESYRAIE